jgi:hypothetical protein
MINEHFSLFSSLFHLVCFQPFISSLDFFHSLCSILSPFILLCFLLFSLSFPLLFSSIQLRSVPLCFAHSGSIVQLAKASSSYFAVNIYQQRTNTIIQQQILEIAIDIIPGTSNVDSVVTELRTVMNYHYHNRFSQFAPFLPCAIR